MGGSMPDRSGNGTLKENREEAMLSIGAISRATLIPVETLRTWERRYGFPIPERKPSGQRVYPVSSVQRLRRIAEALTRGHRAAEVVPASESHLLSLLGTGDAEAKAPGAGLPAGPLGIEELLDVVRAFDSERITRLLLLDWARLGVVPYLDGRIAPLLRAVGEAWAGKSLDIRHEHFLAERVGDVLRSLRLPFDETARGPLVVLATLPGEQHTLGLQMAALTIASAGCRVLVLGAETPVEEILPLVKMRGAQAVGVSVSASSGGAPMTGRIEDLRRLLPKHVTLLAGGEGASPAPGTVVMRSLGELESWARNAAAGTQRSTRTGR